MNKNEIKIGFILGVTGKAMTAVTMKTLSAAMSDKKTVGLVRKIREEAMKMAQMVDSTGSPTAKSSEAYKKLDNKVKGLKGELFAMMPMCQMPQNGRRPKKAECLPSGLCMHDYDGLSNDIKEVFKSQVEPKAEEIGLVFAHITPKGNGLRLITRMPEGMTPRSCQKWVAETVGLTADEAIKDLSRLSFITVAEDILFADYDKLLNLSITEEEQKAILERIAQEEHCSINNSQFTINNSDLPAVTPQNEDPSSETVSLNATPLLYNGCLLYSEIVKRIIMRTCKAGTVVEGQRETECFKVACALRPLTKEFDLTYKVVAPYFIEKGLPDEEIRHAVNSAISRVGAFTSSPTPMVKSILNEMYTEQGMTTEIPTTTIPEDIPEFFKRVMALFPEKLHAPAMMTVLPILGFLATGVRFRYLDGRRNSLSFINVIMAPSSSNKSYTSYLYNIFTEKIQLAEKALLKKEEEDRQNRQENEKVAKRENFKKYNIRLLAADSTMAAIYKRIGDGDSKHKFLQTEEISSLNRGNGSYRNISTIMLHAFDNSEVSKETATDASANIRANVFVNAILCGTNAEVTKFIGNGEDGLGSRICLVSLPSNLDDDIIIYKDPCPDDRIYFDDIICQLQREGLDTEDGTVNYSFPLLHEFISQSLNKDKEQYLLTRDDMWRKLGFRAHVIGYRAAVAAWLVSGKPKGMDSADLESVTPEIQKILNFAEWVIDYVRTMQYYTFGERMQEAIEQNAIVVTRRHSTANVLSYLPETFPAKEINVALAAMGKKHTANPSQYCKRLVESGYLLKTEVAGVYKKSGKAA